MSLRLKIPLLIAGITVIYTGLNYGVQRLIVYPSFVTLERDDAFARMERVTQAIRRELEHLGVRCLDWSNWDDSYNFVVEKDPAKAAAFISANLMDKTFSDGKIDLMCYCDLDGRVVWGELHDPNNNYAKKASIVTLGDWTGAGPRLLQSRAEPTSHLEGIVMTTEGPMLVAAAPIITSEGKGPVRGTVIMGRTLDDKRLEALVRQTGVAFFCWPMGHASMPVDPAARLARIGSEHPMLAEERDANTVNVYTTFPDIQGRPVLLLRADIPREITARGRTANRFATTSVVVIGGIMLVTTFLLLQRTVIGPISRLTAHAVAVGETGDLSSRVEVRDRGEVGVLAAEFNRMVAQLADSRARMVDTAHRAGMADTAVEILHNVGNVINNVNVTTEVLGEQLKHSKLRGLEKAVALMREHRDDPAAFLRDDPRGPKWVDYLIRLSDIVPAEREEMLRGVQDLQHKVRQIRDIIQTQQAYAHGPKLLDRHDLTAVIEEVLRTYSRSFSEYGIVVKRDIDSIPPVTMNKVKLTQVVGNLVKNAVDSMRETEGGARVLTVRVKPSGGAAVRVEIGDTGLGIESGKLTQVFQCGFTTKPGGHGLGLHFCANAVAEMGGHIEARSEGPGRGAVFAFDIPVCAEGVRP